MPALPADAVLHGLDFVAGASPTGPTAPHSPLRSYYGIPTAEFYADAAIQKLRRDGVPSAKLLLGLGFYGCGWDGSRRGSPAAPRPAR